LSEAHPGIPTRPGTRATWYRRWRVGQRLSLALVVLTILATVLTYAVLTGSAFFMPATPSAILVLLNLDLALLLAIAILVAYRIVLLWGERRRRTAGSGLHVRLTALFSLVAAAPAVLVAVFSLVFLHFGLQGWFSTQVDRALTNALTVAEAYVREHSRTAAKGAVEIARQLRHDADALDGHEAPLNEQLDLQRRWRGLQAIAVFDAEGKVSVRTGATDGMARELVPDWAIARARNGEVAVIVGQGGDRLRALVRLTDLPERFLYVGQAVDKTVLEFVGDVRVAVSRFQRLQVERSEIELTFAVIFAILSLLLVMVAIWFGLTFAGRLAQPIAALVKAAERIRAGDLEVRLAKIGTTGEFQLLGRAFNRMTAQLRAQREELIETNRQLDQRRRFTEAVLAGVAAGVIGLDRVGRIRYPNRTANQLLELDLDAYRDRELVELLPVAAPLIARARQRPTVTAEAQIAYETSTGTRSFLVRVTAEPGGDAGYVVTFTDITDLLNAQREAAWSDIARRIAHEIKNPLTPIRLSAERLRRRYHPEIRSDPHTFAQCTDTIVRQVENLRHMVDEFSDFARLPTPEKQWTDMARLVREAVAMQRLANRFVAYAIVGADEEVGARVDAGQMAQVLTNLLKNAVEAVEQRTKPEAGAIEITLAATAKSVMVQVADNGIGLHQDLRDRLADPYVTTRPKGTGLGLAIVQKIVGDHGGRLRFADRVGGGAMVEITVERHPSNED